MSRSKPVALARALTFTAAAVVVAPLPSLAADFLPPAPPMIEPPSVEVGGGWYLRGDVGVGSLDLRHTIAVDASSPPQPYVYDRVQDHVGDQVFVGGGVGYQVNPWLRFDVTGEYRTQTDWRFIAADKTYGTGGYDLLSGRFSSIVGLANAYFDLGTWYGLTPFVGGGVGVAYHMFGSVTDEGLGLYTGGASGQAGGFGYGGPKDKANFAWALHAGLGYAVTPNLKLELAYRYLNMGEARTGVVGCLPSCDLKTYYKVKDLESQDVKIGMRWMFGPVASAPLPPLMPPPEPPPLVRKY